MSNVRVARQAHPATGHRPEKNPDSWSHFGVHLTVDGYKGDPALLDSMERVFEVLDTLPGRLGMHKIMTPYVVRAEANDKKDPGGISGFVMIMESHISVHTFPGRRFVSIDVYTCQEQLDDAKALNIFREAFDLQELEVNVITRGRKFGKLATMVPDKTLSTLERRRTVRPMAASAVVA